MTNEISRYTYEPTSWQDAQQMAVELVRSGLLPNGIKSPQAALAIMITGRELGLTAMQALRGIHVIEGKPTISADMMLALVRRSGECQWWRTVESTAERCTMSTLRRGETEPTTVTWTMADAQRAGLGGRGPWRAYPSAMLRARAKADLARLVYPDVVLGVYAREELAEEREPVTIDATLVAEPEGAVAPEPASDLDAELRAHYQRLGRGAFLDAVGDLRGADDERKRAALAFLARSGGADDVVLEAKLDAIACDIIALTGSPTAALEALLREDASIESKVEEAERMLAEAKR